jgi:CrcB protein
MTGFIFVGLGGAVGAMLRYAISLVPYKHTFPLPTLIINIIGALLIGYIAGLAIKKDMPQSMILFLKTGLCGGFTTFSTFSLEAYELLKAGNYVQTVLYILLSVIGCVIGVMSGIAISKT